MKTASAYRRKLAKKVAEGASHVDGNLCVDGNAKELEIPQQGEQRQGDHPAPQNQNDGPENLEP
jgi:hypothetical protein